MAQMKILAHRVQTDTELRSSLLRDCVSQSLYSAEFGRLLAEPKRGVLLADLTSEKMADMRKSRSGQGGLTDSHTEQATYFAFVDRTDARLQCDGQHAERIQSLVDSYDPTREFVLCIVAATGPGCAAMSIEIVREISSDVRNGRLHSDKDSV